MRFVVVVLLAASLLGCSRAPVYEMAQVPQDTVTRKSIEDLVAVVREDPSKKPILAEALMSGDVLVIPKPGSNPLALLTFDQPERWFIPVFSDRRLFDQEAYGTGFEGRAIAIDARRFAALLKGDEVVILNPGHRPAIEFKASELKALARK